MSTKNSQKQTCKCLQELPLFDQVDSENEWASDKSSEIRDRFTGGGGEGDAPP
jgi:hypothetical protein